MVRFSFLRAVIPVAGVGNQFCPHTSTLPKMLLIVGGRPIMGIAVTVRGSYKRINSGDLSESEID
jgi:UTP-glucose-1-phosphate uridylyltransferase